ncbi:MAG: hypothetical protein HY553_01910 [Elusimicrobia bacterium]|nr:hypothetical protein [Elusimicrobiota bacterium]
MSCREFREALWEAIDAGRAAGGSPHAEACPACAGYARRAARLEAALSVPAAELNADLARAVASRLARPAPEPEGRAALAGAAALVLAAVAAAWWREVDLSALPALRFDPDALLRDAGLVLRVWRDVGARAGAGEVWTLAGVAVALWLSTHRPAWARRTS